MAKKLLVADDNATVRRALVKLFEVEQGYEVCAEARDGTEAIALAIKHSPDLIILDLSMPGMNGLIAARELKGIMPTIPIILFTLHADSALQMTNLHVDRIVSKNDVLSLIGYVRLLVPAW